MSKATKKSGGAENEISYQESKRLARDPDVSVRAALAKRDDVRPEVLYFLAQDDSPAVRREIAANGATPSQANLILAKDEDEDVRSILAGKVAALVPDMDDEAQAKAHQFIEETLEMLARDSALKVRQILAEALKTFADVPPQVIGALARDAEDIVACPVLEFSPCLSDEVLLEIIATGCASGRLKAISRRKNVSADVCDAIVGTDDEPAITDLLSNASAQIREDALDDLVDRAPEVISWHRPLVDRSNLSLKAVRKLTTFIADSLLMRLQSHMEMDEETAQLVAEEVRRRIEGEEEETTSQTEQARKLHADGKLTEELLSEAIAERRNAFVTQGLALMTGSSVDVVDRILSARSAKGVTALCWKAGCGMRFAIEVQQKLGRILPAQTLQARNGTDYPMTEEELEWQWQFCQSLSEKPA